MSINSPVPDYDLAEELEITAPAQLRAMAHPLRGTVLDLLLERAATVAELAAAIGRPPSTLAYHVSVLLDAGMLQVVRTRRVRAIDERYYGRTARLFRVGALTGADRVPSVAGASCLDQAAAEAAPAHQADALRSTLRHARISHEHAAAFWEQAVALAQDFARLPRAGTTTYGFTVGLFATDHPTLPDPGDEAADGP